MERGESNSPPCVLQAKSRIRGNDDAYAGGVTGGVAGLESAIAATMFVVAPPFGRQHGGRAGGFISLAFPAKFSLRFSAGART
jgi:hypothetical protein